MSDQVKVGSFTKCRVGSWSHVNDFGWVGLFMKINGSD